MVNTAEDAHKAERDEYLLIIATISHIRTKISPYNMLYANRQPIRTAIPFPPLNLSQIGNR